MHFKVRSRNLVTFEVKVYVIIQFPAMSFILDAAWGLN